jgi:hypothetical protein
LKISQGFFLPLLKSSLHKNTLFSKTCPIFVGAVLYQFTQQIFHWAKNNEETS